MKVSLKSIFFLTVFPFLYWEQNLTKESFELAIFFGHSGCHSLTRWTAFDSALEDDNVESMDIPMDYVTLIYRSPESIEFNITADEQRGFQFKLTLLEEGCENVTPSHSESFHTKHFFCASACNSWSDETLNVTVQLPLQLRSGDFPFSYNPDDFTVWDVRSADQTSLLLISFLYFKVCLRKQVLRSVFMYL